MPRFDQGPYASHPPLRVPADLPPRPPADGPCYYVDAECGDDSADGSEKAPWRTINASLPKLRPGDTLCLRDGVYWENVYCAVAGRRDAPITVRSCPGERAVIQGGIREFAESPSTAWVPFEGGVQGEFVSAKEFRNIRDVLGLFADSNIGLQTYWHAMDLRADNELWIQDPDEKMMVLPVYCGPGLWYDKQSGRIHVRLAHTHIANPEVPNYRGETDPRKLPLVVAPFASVPLFVDQAMHVRFQDLVIRGGGLNVVVLHFGVDLEFDNVVVFGGTYCLRSRGTGQMRFVHSALHGAIPPWAFRTENGLHTYRPDYYDPFLRDFADPPPNERNIARLPTHAVLVTEGSFEFEVFHYPHNHDWEIAYSEFTDAHDGVYLSGKNIRFHHNWVDFFQDDAIYMSAPSPGFCDNIHITQNLVTHSLMAFSCHSRGGPEGDTYIMRNVADLREGTNTNRPTPDNPSGTRTAYHIYLMHGRRFSGVESLHFCQNTLISPAHRDAYAHRTLFNTSGITRRRVFNNIFVYLNAYRELPPGQASQTGQVTDEHPSHDIVIDGNVHWCPTPGAVAPADYLDKVRNSAGSQANRGRWPEGWEAHSAVADPQFAQFAPSPEAENDYRLSPNSPALGRGVELPEEYEDPFRPSQGRPDAGAIPGGGEPLRVGIRSRVEAGKHYHRRGTGSVD